MEKEFYNDERYAHGYWDFAEIITGELLNKDLISLGKESETVALLYNLMKYDFNAELKHCAELLVDNDGCIAEKGGK